MNTLIDPKRSLFSGKNSLICSSGNSWPQGRVHGPFWRLKAPKTAKSGRNSLFSAFGPQRRVRGGLFPPPS